MIVATIDDPPIRMSAMKTPNQWIHMKFYLQDVLYVRRINTNTSKDTL